MVELWIDEKRCDIENLPVIPIDFDCDKLTSVESGRVGREIEVELPSTPANNLIFGSLRDIYATSRFNMEHHTAEVKSGGVVVFRGTTYLLSATMSSQNHNGYKIRIREGGAEWVEAVVKGGLSDLKIPFAESYTLTTIAKSWEGESAVRFLPVWRGGEAYGYSSSALPIEHLMLTDDYHPFISVATMVRAMFADLGYTLRSNFLDSELGQSLYMSGDYLRGDASWAKSRCDFLARRSTPISATADSSGRVYTTTSMATHTIKAIVDTADPNAFDSDGRQMVDTFNTLNSFAMDDSGNICFAPKSSVKAGFVLHLEYTTDYKIISRERFRGFDVVEAPGGVRVEFPLANTCRDYREELSANWQYRAVVFDHTENREYRLLASTADELPYIMGQWSSRSALVTTSTTKPETTQLLYRDSSTASWALYQGDWALYAGYLAEEGTMDVVMDIRIPPQEVSAGEEYLLDKFIFGGATKGMKITVGNATTLRPYFTAVPGYGSYLQFEDIAPRNIRQSELLTALGEMFNLAFYTDKERKEVYIEPLEELYDEEVIDISYLVDCGYDIEIADSGVGAPQNYRFAYKAGDKASEKLNKEEGSVVGEWRYRNPLYGTTDSEKSLGDGLFTTTLNTTNVISYAPSASLIQIGDVGEQEEGMDSSFTPRIVCYKGLRQLPDGECWIVGNKLQQYPYAAFVDEEEVNLCFESRNGMDGLNTYHLPKLLRQREGQRISLNLTPAIAETASILTENGPKPSIRKTYRFKIQGESSLYRIAKIENLETQSGVVRSTFERILKD